MDHCALSENFADEIWTILARIMNSIKISFFLSKNMDSMESVTRMSINYWLLQNNHFCQKKTFHSLFLKFVSDYKNLIFVKLKHFTELSLNIRQGLKIIIHFRQQKILCEKPDHRKSQLPLNGSFCFVRCNFYGLFGRRIG